MYVNRIYPAGGPKPVGTYEKKEVHDLKDDAKLRRKLRAAGSFAGIVKWDSVFYNFDYGQADGMGLVQFRSLLRKARVSKELFSTKAVRFVFEAIDKDGRGTIEPEDFIRWIIGQAGEKDSPKSPEKQAKKLALSQDLDFIRQNIKIQFYSSKIQANFSWEKVFEEFDEDEDGELDLKDLTDLIRTQGSP